MKTTLGVALTPPTAAALIAGACVLAAAFLPSCHARAPDAVEPPQLTAAAMPVESTPAKAEVEAKPKQAPARPDAVAPEASNPSRSQR